MMKLASTQNLEKSNEKTDHTIPITSNDSLSEVSSDDSLSLDRNDLDRNDLDRNDLDRNDENANSEVDEQYKPEIDQDIQRSNSILNTMMADRNKKSIFKRADIRQSESSTTSSVRARETYIVLSAKDLAKSIPQNATYNCLDPLPANCIEWRWRFFKIGDRKLVEVSHFDGNKRIYTDYNGNKIEYNMNDEWDRFLVKTLYAYVQNI